MTVVVAGADSDEGRAAMHEAVAECRRRGEDLVVFNLSGSQDIPKVVAEEVSVSYREPRERKDAASELLDLAEELPASVVVIGLRHRSRVGKLLLGSIAQQILLEATTPVLAVRSPEA
ncbi:MAG: universal stress protein UspA [Micrococcales bacterium]|nr:MAG: universal stress protein UspA [Micrococcales bacterium]